MIFSHPLTGSCSPVTISKHRTYLLQISLSYPLRNLRKKWVVRSMLVTIQFSLDFSLNFHSNTILYPYFYCYFYVILYLLRSNRIWRNLQCSLFLFTIITCIQIFGQVLELFGIFLKKDHGMRSTQKFDLIWFDLIWFDSDLEGNQDTAG